jgi:vacuolar-type H+-ATPase subunit H
VSKTTTETVTIREHLEAIQEANDRRYAEVALARAEALRIKEVADEKALDLAREIQTYKDEKANELREQISQERGTYITSEVYNERHEELIRRISELEKTDSSYKGKSEGLSTSAKFLLGTITVMTFIIPLIVLVANGVFS